MGTGAWVFVAIVVALVVWAIAIYRALVALSNRFMNAFAQIDVQLKRRYELIASLVESVKADLQHERQTLDAVMAARGNAVNAVQRAAAVPGDPAAMQALAQAEGALASALGPLFEIKSNQNVLALQDELASTESKIAFARQAYNDSVMQYNTKRESFPDNIFAAMFGFTPAELLAATP
jgi:LemA protein